MPLFTKIFNLFRKNKPHADLLSAYAKINHLALGLQRILYDLHQLHQQLVKQQLPYNLVFQRPVKGIGLKKSEFIGEFTNKLQGLAKNCGQRISAVAKKIESSEPLSPLEQGELNRISAFLAEVQEVLPSLEEIKEINSPKKQIEKVEETLRNVTKLASKFHQVEIVEQALARQVLENEISPLLRKIYEHPSALSVPGAAASMLTYPITRGQLRKMERWTEKINSANDPNYKIVWRRWWLKYQEPEVDPTLPIGPHINVTIKLFGGPKKNLHLLLTA